MSDSFSGCDFIACADLLAVYWVNAAMV